MIGVRELSKKSVFAVGSAITIAAVFISAQVSNPTVTKIVAGTNVTVSPTSGIGNVTVNSSGGGGGGVTESCDASTITNYQQAVCVKTLTSAQIKAFDGTSGTAVTAITAPGAGKAVILQGPITYNYTFVTTPYAETSIHLIPIYGGSDYPIVPAFPVITMDQSSSQIAIAFLTPNPQLSMPLATFSPTPVNIYSDGIVTLGDGTITITIPYTVIPVS